MKSIFDKATREEISHRISSLKEDSKAQWGKMNVYQMVRHCTLWEEMIQGDKEYKQTLPGKIFGRFVLKGVLKDENPLRKNTPTLPALKISGEGDLTAAKAKWISGINNYTQFSKPEVMHVFFGRMTKEQVGQLAYKHADHHLRQFGA